MKEKYINDCPTYLTDFLMYIKVIKDHGERTEEAYYIDLRMFLRYLKIKNNLVNQEINFEDIVIHDTPFELIEKFTLLDAYKYLNWLKNDRNNEASTRARKTSAIKQFYKYLTNKAKLLDFDPLAELDMPHIKNKLPNFLTLEQSIKLLNVVQTDNEFAERDYCIITLFLNCGMRLSELCGICINDISFENKSLRLFGKGRKQRIVYLNESCLSALNKYIEIRNTYDVQTNALFLSKRKTPISKRRVQQIVEENLKKSGLNNIGITTHKLRHTAATLMYQYGGVDTMVLKDLLGHKSISTTEIYTHLSNDNLKTAANASPLSDPEKIKK